MSLGIVSPAKTDFEIITEKGHGFGGEVGGSYFGEVGGQNAFAKAFEEGRKRYLKQYGEWVNKIIPLGHITIFPNFSAMDTIGYRNFRVWHPRGPYRTEIYSWAVVDKALPEQVKIEGFNRYSYNLGPAGLAEQDDGENWAECTATMRGWISRKVTLNYQLGLGKESARALEFEKRSRHHSWTKCKRMEDQLPLPYYGNSLHV